MRTDDTRLVSPQFLGWCAVALAGGVCCLALPPYFAPNGLPTRAYGWPLIPWFAHAWANMRMSSAVFYFVLGLALGLAHPRRWWLLGFAVMLGAPILLGINILHDWRHDPTSHNLFPFEFLICGALSAPAFLGVLLGFLLRLLSKRLGRRTPS